MEYEEVVNELVRRLNVPSGVADYLIASYGQAIETESDLNALVRWAKKGQRKRRGRR